MVTWLNYTLTSSPFSPAEAASPLKPLGPWWETTFNQMFINKAQSNDFSSWGNWSFLPVAQVVLVAHNDHPNLDRHFCPSSLYCQGDPLAQGNPNTHIQSHDIMLQCIMQLLILKKGFFNFKIYHVSSLTWYPCVPWISRNTLNMNLITALKILENIKQGQISERHKKFYIMWEQVMLNSLEGQICPFHPWVQEDLASPEESRGINQWPALIDHLT